MSNISKHGIDFFPMDVDFFQDEKIQYVSARFVLKGEAIAVRLMCKIYRNGYYVLWDEDAELLFAKSAGDGCSVSLVNEVVQECLKRGFFDKALFERFSILTSRGLQRRYLEAIKRRKSVQIIAEYILVDTSEYTNLVLNEQNAYISTVNVDILRQNANISSQSTVQESTVQESTEEKRREGKRAKALPPASLTSETMPKQPDEAKTAYGELGNVLLTEDEHTKLVTRLGEAHAMGYIERLSLYIAQIGAMKAARYKSHYATILNWWHKDQDKVGDTNGATKAQRGRDTPDGGELASFSAEDIARGYYIGAYGQKVVI